MLHIQCAPLCWQLNLRSLADPVSSTMGTVNTVIWIHSPQRLTLGCCFTKQPTKHSPLLATHLTNRTKMHIQNACLPAGFVAPTPCAIRAPHNQHKFCITYTCAGKPAHCMLYTPWPIRQSQWGHKFESGSTCKTRGKAKPPKWPPPMCATSWKSLKNECYQH